MYLKILFKYYLTSIQKTYNKIQFYIQKLQKNNGKITDAHFLNVVSYY